MTFQKCLYSHLKTVTGYTIKYGSGYGATVPYYVMQVVAENGQPHTMCETQLNSGEILLQFSYSGKVGQGGSEDQLELLRNTVAILFGVITLSGTSFEIWDNITEGIRQIGNPSIDTWDCIFETTIKWRKL